MNKCVPFVKKIKVLLLWPMLTALMFSLLIGGLVNMTVMKSVMLGSIAIVLPNAISGFYCFRYSGALQMQQIWKSFVRGEVYKLSLSAIICIIAFKYMSVNAMWFMLAFIFMQLITTIINCCLLNR